MHLDEERLQRFAHGELADREHEEARAHLFHCAACSERLAQAEAEDVRISAWIASVDRPPPQVRADAVVARASGFDASVLVRNAATVLVALGLAGAVWAFPGSPLRHWVKAALDWAGPGGVPTNEAPEAPALPLTPTSGVAILPGAQLVVEVTTPVAGAKLRVTLGDGEDVVLQGPAGAARFTAGVDRLLVEPATTGAVGADAPAKGGVFMMDIPRTAPSIEVRVAGELRFARRNGVVRAAAPLASEAGTDVWDVSLEPSPE